MAKNKQSKRQRDIKSKLMAAIAMLLVSTIMMVSSTYAWFTLSTAPEVTGITTAVGANGNLEMALQPLSGDSSKITSAAGDSIVVQDAYLANTTWGNLVDVSDTASYGLNKIMLYPAKLNMMEDSTTTIATSPLAIPEYGADGRVANLATAKTFTGVYDKTSQTFVNSYTEGTGDTAATKENPYGVRAIGTSSSMSDRQLAYRAALAAASNAMSQGKSAASTSLNNNGAKLADIAIKHATSDTTETYTVAELTYLQNIVNDLLGTDAKTGSLEYIEEALIQYALASALAGASDDEYLTIVNDFATVDITATSENLSTMMTNHNATNAAVTDYIDELQTAYTNVAEAKTTLDSLLTNAATGATFTWSQFNSALYELADPDQMQVNGIEVKDLKGNWKYDATKDGTLPDGYTTNDDGYVLDDEGDIVSNMGRLVDAVLNQGGLKLIIASGAGVFADIADFSGDYTANVTLSKVEYGGMSVKNLEATMSTKTSQTTVYLDQAKAAVPAFGGTNAAASAAINDFYGYIIDLAFRTNVADSYLQLQQTAVDRVYSDNTVNEDTMGHGASMTFTSTDATTFSGNAVQSLMECIRIVFYNTDDRTIIGYARLDASSAVTDATTGAITMQMYMCAADGTAAADQKIMALEQNTIHELSVMVYLDGEEVTNADVANAASSMTGSMSLQFSSTATLRPMDYTDLRNGDANDTVDYGKTTSTTTTYKVTINGTDVGQTVNKDASITYTVPEGYTVTAITMGGADVMSSYDSATRVLTISAVTGDIAITATTT